MIRPCIEEARHYDNVIKINVVNGSSSKMGRNKDGSISKRHSNATPGESVEVYPFSEQEIDALFKVLDNRIKSAKNNKEKRIARRNKLLLTVGFNSGLRASDIRTLTWSFFFTENGEFRDFYSIRPQKTKKYKKFVKIYFNDSIKKAIEEYIDIYPVKDYNDYIFKSNKGDDAITVHAIYDTVKKAAKEAGIEKNVGSHSMRKTWGSAAWHNADDKNQALIILQQCFNHSTSLVTARYIGLLDTEISSMYNSVNIGYA